MFTAAERERAALMNWSLCEVYDLQVQKVKLMILPVDFSKSTSHRAQAQVVALAKGGDALAMKALTLISRSNVYKRKK